MKTQRHISYLLMTVLLGFFAQAQASLLFYEGFDYGASDALLTTAGGANWVNTTGDDNAAYVASGLSYGSLATSGGMVQTQTNWGTRDYVYDFADIDISGEDEIWLSMLVQMPAAIGGNTSAEFGMTMVRNSWGGVVEYEAGKGWGNDDAYVSSRMSPNSITGTDYATVEDDTILLVYRFTKGEAGRLWANPTLGSEPLDVNGQVLNDGGNPGLTSINKINITYLGHQMNVDELRIGTTFGDVSPVPEPGALSLMAIAGCVFWVSRRFRRSKRC
ncbi:PEP-CTERM sorting domain-containing protein [Kiritimatiellota bacterium B12222]|nr:PEP-CTERM sorting domain-containing protein [Kiritimatiellota bacterium B12222]